MKQLLKLLLAVLGGMTFFSACQTSYPSITDTETNKYRYGAFVWHDLMTSRADQAQRFYGEVFGWTFETIEDGNPSYTLIKNKGKRIGGIYGDNTWAADAGSEWINLISVENMDNSAKNLTNDGGQILSENLEVKGRGNIMLAKDPQGAYIGLIHSNSGDPIQMTPSVHDWMWVELWAADPDAAIEQYKFFGYEFEKQMGDRNPYYIMKYGEERIGAIIQNPVEDYRPIWVPFIRVEDIAGITSRVEAAGGKVLLAPNPEVRNGTVALFLDPAGAPFAVQNISI